MPALDSARVWPRAGWRRKPRRFPVHMLMGVLGTLRRRQYFAVPDKRAQVSRQLATCAQLERGRGCAVKLPYRTQSCAVAGRAHARTHARTLNERTLNERTLNERTHTYKPKQTQPQLRGRAGGAAACCEPVERRRSHRFVRDLHLYLQTYGEQSQHCQQPGEAVGAADSAGQHRRHGTAARVALAATGHHCLWLDGRRLGKERPPARGHREPTRSLAGRENGDERL